MAEDSCQGWSPIDWQPKDLKVDDRVGLLINGQGEVWLVQNDRRVCKPKCKVKLDKPLYPVLDLLGNTGGVSFVFNAQPPLAFSRTLSGHHVKLSADGLTASHQDSTGQELKGVAFLQGPVPLFEEGAYFEVRVEEVCTGNPDGLTIGITTKKPSMDDPEPATADDVPESWSIGFDGQTKVGAEMKPTDWGPCDLKVGDRVGFFVDYRNQETWLVENGELVVQLPGAGPPMDRPLYGFVDLLGNTVQVALLEAAAPPESSGVRLVGKTQYGSASFFSSFASAIVGATQSSEGTVTAFRRDLASSLVEISTDGKSARRKEGRDDELEGVLFGNFPLPRFDDNVQYFEVCVDSVSAGFPDGLVIGVTAEPPAQQALVTCADEVPWSWTFGYDGSFYHVAPLVKQATFRQGTSLYRVSRFSQSAFRVSVRPDGGRIESDEDEEEDGDTRTTTATGRNGGRRTVAPAAPSANGADEDDEV